MSDVEKYGLFALVFVAGVLGLAWVLDPADELQDQTAREAAGRMVVMSRPSAVDAAGPRSRALPRPVQASRQPANQPGHGTTVARADSADAPAADASRRAPRVMRRIQVPRLDEGLGAFDPAEPPLPYPGEHSVSAPVINMNVPDFVVVKPGDTLSELAQKHLGQASRHPEISALNPGVKELGLVPGQRLRLPRSGGARAAARATPAPAAGQSPRLYTVRAGDTLGAIAQRLKGSVTHQAGILAANRDIISNADQLAVGMTLRIP
ncbi:MAG: hypothetical protein DRQ55_00305 [Planctomycetota bacterium]|nr:MAG: hypothetical protein DRQ55_00305 [Planctomycetota bacterium]